MSNDSMKRIRVLARHEYRAAARNKVLAAFLITLVTVTAVSILIGAIDYRSKLDAYNAYKHSAQASGISRVAPLSLQVLSLLRGAIEYIEIIGAVIAIALGYLSVARERGNRTLPLIRTRPVSTFELAVGTALGALALITTVMVITAIIGIVSLGVVASTWITAEEFAKLTLAYIASIVYLTIFYLLGATLTSRAKTSSNGLLVALVVWLVVVLVLPQIGDTMDADNQLPGGLFAAMGLNHTGELQVLTHFTGYERFRNGLEEVSLAKHYERFAFGMLDVKDKYRGFSISRLLHEKRHDIAWMAIFAALLGAALTRAFKQQPALPTGGE